MTATENFTINVLYFIMLYK